MADLHLEIEGPHTPDDPEKTLAESHADPEKLPPSKSLPSNLDVEFPEGGREAWLTMAGAWMVQFCTFGHHMMVLGSTLYVLCIFLLSLTQAAHVGRLVNNSISPRIGSFNLVVSSLYACAVLIFAMLAIKTFAGLAVFVFLYGFTSGAYASLMPTNFVGFSNHPGEYGIRLGIALTVVAPAMLVGNPFSGPTGHFTWAPAVIFNAVLVAVGATFILVARVLYIKRKGTGHLV
ncbi:hypothetical protein C8R44DRAFT_863820 [Mycena epipterygia]|nr:hypothetical protein C8R44DRAFT_863820 [Mycena epipterygia]